MAEADNTGTEGTDPPNGQPDASGGTTITAEPKFTQADLDKHAGRRAAEAKRAAAKELAEKLGCTVDEAAAKLKKLAEQEEAEKTEAQRAQEAEAAAKAEAEQARAEAAEAKFENRVYRKLSAAGVGAGMEDEAAEKQIARARRLLDVTPEATDDEIAEQIAEIKADVPGLFTAKAEPGKAPSGVTNGKPPATGQGTQSPMERGRDRYRSSRPDPSKQTDPFSGPAFRRVG